MERPRPFRFTSLQPRRGTLAHGLGVAGGEFGVVRVRADIVEEAARADALLAGGLLEHHRDARLLVEPEGGRRAAPLFDLDERGDARFRRSRCRRATASSSGSAMVTIGAASSEEPITLFLRSISSAPVTTRRTARTFSHLAISLSSRHSAGRSGNSRRCTDSPAPG